MNNSLYKLKKGEKMKKIVVLMFAIMVLLSSCADNRTAQEIYNDSNKLANQKEFEKAIVELQLIEEKYPEDVLVVESIYKMAEIYMQNMHNFSEAATNYNKLADNFPSSKYSAKSRFMAGFLYANKINDLEKAKETYSKFLQEHPGHELIQSVEFELRNLGVPIEKIEELKEIIGNDKEKK